MSEIEQDIEIVDKELPQRYTPEQKKEVINQFNCNPIPKKNDIEAIDKTEKVAVNKMFFYSYLIVTTILVIGLLVWFGFSFYSKDFSTSLNITNEIQPSEVQIPVNIENNFTISPEININSNCTFPDEMIIRILNETG